MDTKQEKTRPNMTDTDNIGSGVFSNIINITTNTKEIFLDFGVSFPKDTEKKEMGIKLVSRVILTKDHAKEFSVVLKRLLEQK
jgi:hypothetical protein